MNNPLLFLQFTALLFYLALNGHSYLVDRKLQNKGLKKTVEHFRFKRETMLQNMPGPNGDRKQTRCLHTIPLVALNQWL